MPDARILDVRSMFSDSREWPERWPWVLYQLVRHRIAQVAFITAADGTIGRGVAKEIADAHERLLLVSAFVLESSELVLIENLAFIPTKRRRWTEFCYVIHVDYLFPLLFLLLLIAALNRKVTP
jgi:hypothetical protein